MKNKISISGAILILLLVFCLSPAVLAQKHYKDLKYPKLSEMKVPEPTQMTLENGITVFLLEDHELPFISMNAMFVAGNAWEPAEKVGLAGITGQVMRTGGTKAMPGDQMDEELENIAASVETYIGEMSGGASMSTLKDHFDKVFAIYIDVLMNPAFPDDKIDLAKIEYRSAISRRNDDVGQIANREFYQLIYGDDSPYARDMEYEHIDAITREDIINFHKKNVQPNGMILGVWGDFDPMEIIKKIKNGFKDWKAAGEVILKAPEVKYEFKKTVNLVEKTDVNQTNIYIGHIGGKKDNPDFPALIMMNEVLSGGFSGRLLSRVRSDQGLAYSVYGSYGTNYVYPGTFFMLCQTKSGSTVQAIRSMLKEMRLMTEELVTDEELKIAKEGFLNSFVFNFDSVDEIMGRLLTYAYYGYPMDFLQTLRKNIEAVTRKDILRVAKKYLKPDQVQILAVGKSEDFDESLSALGKVNEIDITIPTPEEDVPEATGEALSKGKILFKKMIKASGGESAFKTIDSYQWKGSTSVVTPQGEMVISAEKTVALPDRIRVNMTTPGGEMSQIYNKGNAWMVSPVTTIAAPETMRKEIEGGLWRDFLVLFRHADHPDLRVQHLGKEDVEGQQCDILLIAPKEVKSFKIFLNSETMLPMKMSYVGPTMMGSPANTEEMYYEFKKVEAISIPFRSVKSQNGKKVQETTTSEFLINVAVDDSLFTVEKKEE
jgi:predicted Zn-dependent peptidase/outer membrane lipoprotein-sorting protein